MYFSGRFRSQKLIQMLAVAVGAMEKSPFTPSMETPGGSGLPASRDGRAVLSVISRLARMGGIGTVFLNRARLDTPASGNQHDRFAVEF
jgi:hypothetical protein